MNFAECTRESSSSDGWNGDEAEDEENAKHIIIGVVEKRSNDDDKRRRKWKLLDIIFGSIFCPFDTHWINNSLCCFASLFSV